MDADIQVKKAELTGLDKMIEEKNKEMKNLTETMQKKIESINDEPSDENSKQSLDQIKALEEKSRKYEAQIL